MILTALLLSVALEEAGPAPDEQLRSLIVRSRTIVLEAGDAIWPGFGEAPFGVLLVEAGHETLFCHDGPAGGFTPIGHDPVTGCAMHSRARQFPENLLASFPAVDGVPTIVMGTPEATGREAPYWALTLAHEHFHQLQNSQPGYFDGVRALDLAGDDTTGMWMLNYPFPYDVPEVSDGFAGLAGLLLAALEADEGAFADAFTAYAEARAQFAQAIPAQDWRYGEFQLWQEGVARWTEAATADLLSAHVVPEDWPSMDELARRARERVRSELSSIAEHGFEGRGRVAFYPLGAGEAEILERAGTGWRARYFAEPFALGPYFVTPQP